MRSFLEALATVIGFTFLIGMGWILVKGATHPDPKVRDAATTAILMMP